MPSSKNGGSAKEEIRPSLASRLDPAFDPQRPERMTERPDYAPQLEAALRDRLQGEVRFGKDARGAYAHDASNYRQAPIGVVIPQTVDDVVATFDVCRTYGAPIVSRGGGTSLAGQCCNVAVVIDYSKYLNRVLEIDPDRKIARVQPGCKLDSLRDAAAEHGLTFGPDPATHNRNTLGGMIGNNSCGVHSVHSEFYGPGPLTEDNVESLEVLLYDGSRFTVGKTDDDEYLRIVQAGGRRAEVYRALRDLRDRFAETIRERYPEIPRRVSGYSLHALLSERGFDVAKALVGSEGTCTAILEATVRLIEAKSKRTLVAVGYPSVYEAGDHVPTIMKHKPVGFEGMDEELVGYMRMKGLRSEQVELLPEGAGWALVEFGADTKEEADAQAQRLVEEFAGGENPPAVKTFSDPEEQEKLWEVRESGLGATAHVPHLPEMYPGWEDSAVDPKYVGDYLRELRDLLHEFGYEASLYGHFGQGCIHCRISFDLKTEPGIRSYLRFVDRAADLVVKYGGSLSGEHGDGQARAAMLRKTYGPELVEAFGEFKAIWDPDDKMNPGKAVGPYMPDQNLKFSPRAYRPATPDTHFRYLEDKGSFSRALERCVGVGKCRRDDAGIMCPSYMVTGEEIHSTRGRARLLFEMLQGDVVDRGFRDESVKEALDLCLACKGCKNECPVNVDVATYKAEFLSGYYKGRLRPRSGYAMGLIYWWARIASKMPGVANFVATHEPFATAAKWAGGIAQERDMPTFASPTFRKWFENREERRTEPDFLAYRAEPEDDNDDEGESDTDDRVELPVLGTDDEVSRRVYANAAVDPFPQGRVVLWPDTFNNYLTAEPARAAVEVLERAGYVVEIPPRPLCCGRPLFDYGMLDTVKKLYRQTLETLRPAIVEGLPIVGLEPSCVASFRDEMPELLDDEDAQRLSTQIFLLSEFLERQNFDPPKLRRKALVHGHCHQKSVLDMDAEVRLLRKLDLDFEVLDSGCCGMAGSFGFEKEKYEVSVKCGERVLLPAVRSAAPETLIIANGFSCRQQIEQLTERKAMHLAEVLLLALNEGRAEPQERTSAATPAEASR